LAAAAFFALAFCRFICPFDSTSAFGSGVSFAFGSGFSFSFGAEGKLSTSDSTP
jgi:hypothetical protein